MADLCLATRCACSNRLLNNPQVLRAQRVGLCIIHLYAIAGAGPHRRRRRVQLASAEIAGGGDTRSWAAPVPHRRGCRDGVDHRRSWRADPASPALASGSSGGRPLNLLSSRPARLLIRCMLDHTFSASLSDLFTGRYRKYLDPLRFRGYL